MQTILDYEGKREVIWRDESLKLWFDREGDLLEVTFDDAEGFFRETENDQAMERVNKDGNILGFSVTNVSRLTDKPLEVALKIAR